MREILSLHIGNFGIQSGHAFVDAIMKEHNIDPSGILMPNTIYPQTFFEDISNATQTRLIPRSIFIDSDQYSLDILKNNGNLSFMCKPDSFCLLSNFGHNFANFHNIPSEELFDNIRKNIEHSDSFQGFQITHSMIGACGSGMTYKILEFINEEFSSKISSFYSLFDTNSVSNSAQIYNELFLLSKFVDQKNTLNYVIDNQALNGILVNSCNILHPTFSNYNELIAEIMSNATCGYRFPGPLNYDMRKIMTNLIPYPGFHFVSASLAPLKCRFDPVSKINTHDLVKEAYYTQSYTSKVHCGS